MGCFNGQSPCSPTPRQPDQCRRLKTCSECLARHPKTFSSPSQVTYKPFILTQRKTATVRQLKYLLIEFPSLLCSVSGAQTVQKAPVSAALLAVRLNMTVGSTRERSSCPATAQRPAVRLLTAPSALLPENACGLASSSAQVRARVLQSLGEIHNFLKGLFIYFRSTAVDFYMSFLIKCSMSVL